MDEKEKNTPKITQEEVLSNQQPKNTDAQAKWTDRQLSDVQKFKDSGNVKKQSKCQISNKYKILIGVLVLIFVGMLIGLSVALSKIFKPQVKEMQKQNEIKFEDGSQLSISELIVELKNLRKKNEQLKIIHSQTEASKINQTSGEKISKKYSDTITFQSLGIIIKVNSDSSAKVMIHPQTFVGYMKQNELQISNLQNSESSEDRGQWQKQLVSQLIIKFSNQSKNITQRSPFVQYCLNDGRFQQCPPKEEKKTRILEEKSDKSDKQEKQEKQDKSEKSDKKANIIEKKQLDKKAQQIFDYVMQIARKCRSSAKSIKQFVDSSKSTKKDEAKDNADMKLKTAQPKKQKKNDNTKPFQQPTLAEEKQNNCIPQSSTKLLCPQSESKKSENNWIQISVKQI